MNLIWKPERLASNEDILILLLDLPWFQSKPCEDLTQLTCGWPMCQIDDLKKVLSSTTASPDRSPTETGSRDRIGTQDPVKAGNKSRK
jgi:hypothetical protein